MLFFKGFKEADSLRNKRSRRYNLTEVGSSSVYSRIARYIYKKDTLPANVISQ